MPLISLILAAIAVAASPSGHKYWMALIPVADIGNWQLVIFLPWLFVKETSAGKAVDRNKEGKT